MSKFDFAKLREQIVKTGESLKEQFKGTDNHLVAGSNRKNDPNWQKANEKKYQSKEWQEKQAQKNQELAQDSNWLAATTKASKKKAQDPKWLAANQKGIEKRKAKGQELKDNGDMKGFRKLFGVKDQHSKKTLKKMSASASERWAKQMKKVHAQGKIYESIYTASDALGIHKDTVVYRIKSVNYPDFYYIE